MRKIYLLLLMVSFVLSVNAKHITGGEMMYEFVSYNAGNQTYTYRIILRLFRDAQNCTTADNCADLPIDATIGIYNNDNNAFVSPYRVLPRTTVIDPLPIVYSPPCLTNSPVFHYQMGVYTLQVTLPANFSGYTVTYQTCCRVNNICLLYTSPSPRD